MDTSHRELHFFDAVCPETFAMGLCICVRAAQLPKVLVHERHPPAGRNDVCQGEMGASIGLDTEVILCEVNDTYTSAEILWQAGLRSSF